MLNRRLALALLSGLITSAGAAQEVESSDVFCTTYLSTYLVAVSSTNNVSVVGSSASETLDTTLADYASTGSGSNLIPDFSTVTRDENEVATNLATASPTISPAQPVTNRPLVFRIIPDTQDAKQGLRRRDLGGLVGSAQGICAEASVFSLSNGRLLQGTAPVVYVGEDFKELRGQSGAFPEGAITATFFVVDDSLLFRNNALPNDQADFCQTPENSQTYITFTSSPPGCVAVRLSIVEDAVMPSSTNTASRSSESLSESATSFPDFTQHLATDVTQSPEVTSAINFPTLDPSTDGFIKTVSTRKSPFPFSNTSVPFDLSTARLDSSDGHSFTVELPSTDSVPLPITSETSQQSIDPSTIVDSVPTVSLSFLSPVTSEETSSEAIAPSVSTSLVSTSLETDIANLDTSTTISDSTTIIDSESTSSFSVESTSFSASTESSTVETTTTTAAPSRACTDSFNFQPTTLFAGDQLWDNEVKSIELPWPVGIYTDSSDKIHVGVNGLVTLFDDAATESENAALPTNSISSVAVCPYWDDLRIEPNAGHEITYQIYDSDGYRAVAIEWYGVDSNDVLTQFVVRFQEYSLSNPDSVFMRYYTTSEGGSATIDVQDGNVNKFLQYSFNQDNAVPDGSTVLFFTLGGDERTVYVGP
ncbi:hypothetical protein FLAG1_08783 [Fusarium langsethiae]|uniref:DUF7908 domain-containing protein n=1 Tax=Fusarium langsethiae TaxID=179993 RepID=A0A0M9ERW6_FUSLA|nr:hypothetical protein FLAG1_08783 [Fusarium langsethiae]GKU06068.1 unnamed protein product [Fusarium langsethiae]GKU09848.1 unnamed protein product [Fusarium langsethiae]